MSSCSNTHSPLLQRPQQQPIARLTLPLTNLQLSEPCTEVSESAFINHVLRLAARLPDHRYVINLCDNRYLFLVSLCAVIVRKQTNLLPPNKNPSTQEQLFERYGDCLLLHDGSGESAANLNQLDISTLDWSLDNAPRPIPMINNDHESVISFTSGSTGQSKPNLKLWRTLTASSKINARYMLVDKSVCHSHIATVPGQHMWGFETSVLLAMFANVCLVDARPFFPHDILCLLDKLPSPTTLISAPLHLKTLVAAMQDNQLTDIELSSVLCATAPLDKSLANNVERQFNTQLREIYGCSEVGSMAVRATTKEQAWEPFEGLQFSHDGNRITVDAIHLPMTTELEDSLSFLKNGRFELAGRSSDQVKIAGKRGSLAEVNAVLDKYDGVVDGTVFFPPQNRNVPRLVALVTLKENISKADVRDHMATHLDAAFVPRPILIVDSLPREDNGKIAKSKLLELYTTLIS